jgi:tetratricopeptide (TPR) repeat protein
MGCQCRKLTRSATPPDLVYTPIAVTSLDLVMIAKSLADGANEQRDRLTNLRMTGVELYGAMVDYRSRANVPIVSVRCELEGVKVLSWYRTDEIMDAEDVHTHLAKLAFLSDRTAALGGTISFEIHELSVIPLASLRENIRNSGDEFFRRLIALWHGTRMGLAYIQEHDRESARYHGELAFEYEPKQGQVLNNLGYFFLADNDFRRARECLTASINIDGRMALPHYNLAILNLLEGDLGSARDSIMKAEACLIPVEDEQRAVLLIPIIEAERLRFEEQAGGHRNRCVNEIRRRGASG